ncbi:MAG: hypothetical protein WBV96_17900, partial [Polyangia bacterium]
GLLVLAGLVEPPGPLVLAGLVAPPVTGLLLVSVEPPDPMAVVPPELTGWVDPPPLVEPPVTTAPPPGALLPVFAGEHDAA